MNEFLLNLGVVLIFTLIGGFFAAAEIALVSLRESQVQRLAADRGKRGQKLATLVAEPNRFLAASLDSSSPSHNVDGKPTRHSSIATA